MVISKPESTPNGAATGAGGAAAAAGLDAAANSLAHRSGIPQDQIDNIMSGIANTGDVKMNNHRKKLRQRFDIIKKLGQGTYGKVQLGVNKETGQEVAIKTIKKCKIEAEADLVRIRREVQIMSSVQHPNIIHIYEVFENREKMVLVMEFAAGGELYDYLSERKVLNEVEARRIFRQVATAVYYCHKHKICHRDLKLENILLDEQGNAKIADFGLSNVFDDQRLLGTFCGSPLYASPEIVEGTPYQGPEVDCWSLGVLLYTLVYGSMPFDGSNFKRLVKQISQGDYYEPHKPSRASTLIRDMLTVCPRKRATIEQICSHWWVNENDKVSCLDLAENLANQTPVRLDVLLSLTPTAITADQLVVPSAEGAAAAAAAAKAAANERVQRSHSVGSIRDIGAPNTEAERRILDMVAAGGEAALMPSPTRTITPAQSPVQTKRKLQPTVSTENAAGTTAKKKEKPANSSFVISEGTTSLLAPPANATATSSITPQAMETESVVGVAGEEQATSKGGNYSPQDMQQVGNVCEQLMGEPAVVAPTVAAVARQATRTKLDAVAETPEEKDASKVIQKFLHKHKTADLVNAINESASGKAVANNNNSNNNNNSSASQPAFIRKCSLQDESTLNKFNAERRKSRILETAEKFQPPPTNTAASGPLPAPASAPEKPKKLSIPGVSVGSFKKEFERKATNPTPVTGPTPGERRAQEQVAAAAAAAQEAEAQEILATPPPSPVVSGNLEASDSKNSVSSISLDEARRSMENSIALLRQAQNESNKELDQLCAQTETIGVSESTPEERERKLKNARTIIGNAIQPVIRRPTPLFGIGNGFGSSADAGGVGGILTKSGSSMNNNNNNSNGSNRATTATTASAQPLNALAVAKQTIQQRLFAGGMPGSLMQRPAMWQPQAAYSTASIFQPALPTSSPFRQLQQQYQQKCHEQQQQQQQQRSVNSALFTPPTSPLYAPSHAYVQAQSNNNNNNCNNSNSHNNNNNTMPIVNYNVSSRTRPFHNQAQDTLNTSALPAAMWLKSSPGADAPAGGAVKTSTASITLKSATLPRRKINAKSEVQLDIKPRIAEQPQPAMRFSTEMQHPVADLRSAPPREGPIPYSPIKTSLQARATSLEPKEHIITIQRPPTQPAYGRTNSNTTTRSGSLSRQSTADSETETATTMSQSTITGGPVTTSQPIKKSPREFIIPIAVEGGGFITPRERSIEPSESSHTTASSRTTFSRLRPSHRIGSLLSESGFDESSPFQKMRTTSINREGGDDESLFTPHRLRSSRPVKKISQDNDSQSSGEEDDDDGFEILTAENLFSTLLQRVRALTNRMNVNSDLTSGFPSHPSRLLTDISRQAQGHRPFWSQNSNFGSALRSQVSYSYTETVEKKQVRLNSSNNSSGIGAPWRHSMSRDLGSDMESMFSRTGATLPRGHHTKGTASKIRAEDNGEEGAKTTTTASSADGNAGEPLDLADLDLSRLRLSKKDLETLSSITPGLPKCFQEQLLAKLPPTQARKLSRTLSVQSGNTAAIKVYKRSQSSGRGYLPEQPEEEQQVKPKSLTDAPKTTAASTAIYRRSLSRAPSQGPAAGAGAGAGSEVTATKTTSKSRSSSVCRDDYGKSSLCSSNYTSDISDKYKYYSPYLSKSSNGNGTVKELPEKRYSAALGRPPSGYLSPPPAQAQPQPPVASVGVVDSSSSLRRRSSQRRISRFLRPDFFDEPREREREREAQSVLREIREKSCDPLEQRKHSLPNVEADTEATQTTTRHAIKQLTEATEKRRSQSRSRELDTELGKHELANKILEELQLLSAVRTQTEHELAAEEQHPSEETATIKKLKKIKSKEANNDAEASKPTTLVRKVKKVAKKATDEVATSQAAEAQANELTGPKETKLKRPKSYPMKDLALSLKGNAELPETTTTTPPSKLPTTATEASLEAAPRESRLMRPKSYPATKLAMPKDLRKITRSGVAITNIVETTTNTTTNTTASSSKSTSEEKSFSGTIMDKETETRPTSMKKVIKVSKKSKLVPPTPVTPPTTSPTTTTTTTTPADSSKESSPVIKAKEKSPEKKTSKGLLYAIGQKFEKLRDSAMSKEKKLATPSSSGALVCTQKQGSPEERSSPEKATATLLRKKKCLEAEKCSTLETEKVGTGGAGGGDKRSRFDSMLRSLRERSVPRTQPATSVSPKRSASVEQLHDTGSGSGNGSGSGSGKPSGTVNKMLGGLLRRFDRESSEQRRVRNTRSTSNIEREMRQEQERKQERESVVLPTSPIYQNVAKTKAPIEVNCNCDTVCPECTQNQGAAGAAGATTATTTGASNKEKRKGLMLDLSNVTSATTTTTTAPATTTTTTASNTSGSYRGAKTQPALLNGNGLYSNLPPYPGAMKSASSNNSSSQQSMDNATNNNSINTNNNCSSQTSGYRTSSAHEINRNNLLTPSFENIANYSSDSRSYQDDCASTSTFMSPTEEPELYFDNWSICSEDNYMLHATPSPTVSRLSRASQLSSPTRCSESSDPNESVIDRIKRRSFYSRFNEQKPRRTSSIVGPSAVRDYYREQHAAVKARSSQKLHATEPEARGHSPDIAQQFFRPLKLSPVGTELKPPVYRSALDYSSTSSTSAGATSKPRKSLNDIRNTSPSFLSKRYETHDYSSVPMRYKSSSSSSPSTGTGTGATTTNGYYNTYNPKRRSSYTLNGTLTSGSGHGSIATGSSHLDGYATLGRRSIRPYDHRTMSLLEPPTTGSTGGSSSAAGSYHRREARTPVRDYTSSISRSGSRYRTSSATRSPTNI
ncbi:mucin-19 isoform X3 [Drosophila innubila]|uniref:mucin-19 isoform X3 n=1 Tax=Drosophila innubila TaxID=198719 RepID=UPI00148D5A95|nr:mucin-19 isoform X3 [Drosophila innubila]